jgi:hypothetical protein
MPTTDTLQVVRAKAQIDAAAARAAAGEITCVQCADAVWRETLLAGSKAVLYALEKLGVCVLGQPTAQDLAVADALLATLAAESTLLRQCPFATDAFTLRVVCDARWRENAALTAHFLNEEMEPLPMQWPDDFDEAEYARSRAWLTAGDSDECDAFSFLDAGGFNRLLHFCSSAHVAANGDALLQHVCYVFRNAFAFVERATNRECLAAFKPLTMSFSRRTRDTDWMTRSLAGRRAAAPSACSNRRGAESTGPTLLRTCCSGC